MKYPSTWMKVASVALIGALAGCSGGNNTSEESSTGGKAPAKISLAFVTNGTADFWSYAEAGVRTAEAEFGDVEVQFKQGDGSPIFQRKTVDNLIVKGIQGLAISPTSPKDQTEILNKWAEKIPLICQDSDAPDSKRIAYLGTDNVAAGRKCGELVKEALPEGGKIMVFVGLKDAQNAIERFQGLKEALEGTKVEIIDLRTDNTDYTKARSNAETTITKYPDIAGLVGLWGYNPPAILEAVKAQNKLGQIKIIGFDEDERTLKGIDEGHIHGTVVQNPYQFGYQSVKVLRALAQGKSKEEAGIPENGQIIVETKVLKKGDGEAYIAYCKSLKEKAR